MPSYLTGKKIKLFSEPAVPKKAEAKAPIEVEEKKAEKTKRPPPKALSM